MGSSLFTLCAVALLGAFGGGLASALVTYYLAKRNEKLFIANEEKRTQLIIEMEKQRAEQQ